MADGDNFSDFPSWELMNFSNNCTIWGDWLGIVLTPDTSLGDTTRLIGPSIWSGTALFITSLPDNGTDYQGNRTIPEVYARISQWYAYNIFYQWNGTDDFSDGNWIINPDFINNVVIKPALQCPDEYCHALAYVGNSDLTGIGTFMSYLIEALFVSFYLFAFTAYHIRRYFKKRRGPHNSSPKHAYKTPTGMSAKFAKLSLPRRTFDSFRGSLDGFLTAAMLICISMLCASLYLDAQGIQARNDVQGNTLQVYGITTNVDFPFHSTAPYDMILSFLASCFSVFPVMLLYAMRSSTRNISAKENEETADAKRGVWLHRCFLVIIWILTVVEVFLSPKGNLDYSHRNDPDNESNTDPCNHRGGAVYWNAMNVAAGLVVGVPLLWVFVTAFLHTGFGISGVVHNRLIRRWRAVWSLGVAWINLIIMWTIFFYFASLRIDIIHSAGASDAQNTWGFGQVLALGAWIPVVAEFGYIFIWGIEEGLDSHMPEGFEVQRVNTGLLPYPDDSVGPDPYEIPQGGFGNEKQATLVSNVQGQYHGGEPAAAGHETDTEAQIASHNYYSGSTVHHRQTAA